MVKDEDDIIEDWILYHGYLFGYENLHIVDNFSTDNTYEILQKYSKKGVNLSRHKEYKEKGIITNSLMWKYRTKLTNDFLYPIDSDEFIVFLNKQEIKTDKNLIINYLNDLKHFTSYKTRFICPNINILNSKRPCISFEYGKLYPEYVKTFFRNIRLDKIKIDHGNHHHEKIPYKMRRGIRHFYYLETNLCLLHFYDRGNLEKLKNKIHNSVKGRGYPVDDVEELKKLSKDCDNFHNVTKQISILEGTFKIENTPYMSTDINLQSFIDKLKLLR